MAAAGLAALLGGCALPRPDPAELPRTYLEQAQQAVAARDSPGALAAIDHAAALWRRNNPETGNPMIFQPNETLQAMLHARQAVGMGRWQDANYYIATALTHPSTITPP